jgi:hypothetical protein
MNPNYVRLCSLYKGEPGFAATRNDIEMTKALIERYMAGASSPRQQLKEGLSLLMGLHRERKYTSRDLCRELIDAAYRQDWTAAQQAYFDDAYDTITVKFDFFLSFTTRYPYVNLAYKWFIRHVLPPDVLTSVDEEKTNLLAEAIYRLLKKPPLQGFYFPDWQYDNTETVPKIINAAANSRVFIQLIQNIMFEAPAGNNYCFDEYSRAVNSGRSIVFVVGERRREDLTRYGVIPVTYRDWYRHVTRVDPPYLQEVDFPDDLVVRRVKEAIEGKLLPHIFGAIYRIEEGVPD